MNNVQLIWFQTTKGHHGIKSLYLNTLDNLKKQIDLSFFDQRILSLKVFNEDKYEGIVNNFPDFLHYLWHVSDERINDESPFKDYAYYLLNNYLCDIGSLYLNISKLSYSKYTLLFEDDSPIIVNKNSLEFYIQEGIKKLESDPGIFSVHFRRESELKGSPNYCAASNNDIDLFLEGEHDYNFQNQIFRTEEMIAAAKIITTKYPLLSTIHTERACRIAIETATGNRKFCQFNPRLAHSIHIGTADNENWLKSYEL